MRARSLALTLSLEIYNHCLVFNILAIFLLFSLSLSLSLSLSFSRSCISRNHLNHFYDRHCRVKVMQKQCTCRHSFQHKMRSNKMKSFGVSCSPTIKCVSKFTYFITFFFFFYYFSPLSISLLFFIATSPHSGWI